MADAGLPRAPGREPPGRRRPPLLTSWPRAACGLAGPPAPRPCSAAARMATRRRRGLRERERARNRRTGAQGLTGSEFGAARPPARAYPDADRRTPLCLECVGAWSGRPASGSDALPPLPRKCSRAGRGSGWVPAGCARRAQAAPRLWPPSPPWGSLGRLRERTWRGARAAWSAAGGGGGGQRLVAGRGGEARRQEASSSASLRTGALSGRDLKCGNERTSRRGRALKLGMGGVGRALPVDGLAGVSSKCCCYVRSRSNSQRFVFVLVAPKATSWKVV